MASIYARGSRLWCRVKDGRWVSKATPFGVGEEARALRYAKAAQETIDARKPPVAREEHSPNFANVAQLAAQRIIGPDDVTLSAIDKVLRGRWP